MLLSRYWAIKDGGSDAGTIGMGSSPRRRHRLPRAVLLLIALFSLIVIGALVAGIIHVSTSGEKDNRKSPGIFARIVDHRLDPAIFSAIPYGAIGTKGEQAIAQTSSDSRSLEKLSSDQARAHNAEVPVASDVGPAASPFTLAIGDGLRFGRALDCMTAAIYYEAANEPLDGQRAVAQVVINRSRHFAYPHSICGVVYQGWERSTGCQFSFTCNGSIQRTPVPALWERARRVAGMALAGLVYAPVGLATHYHADYVVPYWASTLVKQSVIGRHIFYRWPGAWGTKRSFVTPYDANETDIRAGDVQLAGDSVVPDPEKTAGPAVATAARPVLMTDAAAAQKTALDQNPNKVYLMSRNPLPQAAGASAKPSRGVTGGVIMPDTASLPAPQSTPVGD